MTYEMTETHKVIHKCFRTGDRRNADNMPILTRRGTRGTLAGIFGELGFTKGLEVGTRWGVYAMVLCKENKGLHLTCVDPWKAYGGWRQGKMDQVYAGAAENLKPFNVTIIRKRSMDALNDFKDGELDFAYIDGAHDFDNACPDIIFWSYKVRRGGIVAVHDYMSGQWAGVMQAVNAYTHCHHIHPWYVTREREPTAFWVKP